MPAGRGEFTDQPVHRRHHKLVDPLPLAAQPFVEIAVSGFQIEAERPAIGRHRRNQFRSGGGFRHGQQPAQIGCDQCRVQADIDIVIDDRDRGLDPPQVAEQLPQALPRVLFGTVRSTAEPPAAPARSCQRGAAASTASSARAFFAGTAIAAAEARSTSSKRPSSRSSITGAIGAFAFVPVDRTGPLPNTVMPPAIPHCRRRRSCSAKTSFDHFVRSSASPLAPP